MSARRNIYLWYVVTFFQYAAFTLPIWVIFNTETLSLSNTEAFLLSLLPYGLSALFEVPTGSWADKFGRVQLYRLGTILYITSVASYLFTSNFYLLVLCQVIGGLGLAMQSGCLEALIHDSVEDGPSKDIHYASIHGKRSAITYISRVVTVLSAGWLYSVNPRAPFLALVICYCAGLLISLFITEVRPETPSTASSAQHIKQTWRLMLGNKALMLFLVLAVLYGFCSEALFAFYQPYFKDIAVSIDQFGVFFAVISACSVVGSLLAARLIKAWGSSQILLALMGGVLCTLALALFRQPALTYLAVIPSSVAFGIIGPLQSTIIQKHMSSRHKATALSIGSFAKVSAFVVPSLMVGVLLDILPVSTLHWTLTIVTAACLLPFIIYRRQTAG